MALFGRFARLGFARLGFARLGFARLGFARLARRLGLGRNPLRRRTDRLEAAITAVLLAVFLLAAPLSAIVVGQATRAAGQREQQAQRSWHEVTAVVLRSVPSPPRSAARTYGLETWAPVRWTMPGGRARTYRAQVTPGTRAGATVRIWVDASGRVTGPPLLPSQLTSLVIGAEVVAPLVLAVLLLAVARVVRWLLDRRRLAEWEQAWATVGPGWTRRR